jgi:galactonate dehydratase
VRRGYRSCKLKARPWRDLAAQLDAVTAAVPAGFTTIIDFNGFLRDAAQAEAYLRLIDGLPIVGGYESPFYLQTDTAGAAALAEALKQPIFEHFHATVLHARAADGFLVAANYMPLGETRRQDTLCAAFSRPYWLQMVGTGITTAFMAHLGAVLEAATLPAVTCHELWEDDLLVERLEVKDGSLAVPDGPGLGVAVDTEAIARYRVADSKTPTPKDLYLARPRTIRIHIPPPGPVGTAAAAPGGDAAQVLEFPSEQAYYREFLEGRHPGFRPGTRLEVIEDTAAESHAPPG